MSLPETGNWNSLNVNHDIGCSHLNETDLVCVNVCGMNYDILKSTLERFPSTLLGNEKSRKKYYVKCKNALFFDRNRKCFDAILYYYQTGGILLRPPDIPMPMFTNEINFFELGETALTELQRKEGYLGPDAIVLPKVQWQISIWKLFEFPDSSVGARVVASISIFVITLSIAVFCMETMPMLKDEDAKKNIQQMLSSHENQNATKN